MTRGQKTRIPLYERTQLFRIYEPGIIPGLFQTADYASAIIGHVIELDQIPNDLEQAVAARMERQHVLHTGDRRFLVVLEEQALRTRVGDAVDVMTDQLNRLLAIMSSRHRVSLGIIPSMGYRYTWFSVGFWIFDRHAVHIDTPSAELTITQRSEIAVFEKSSSGINNQQSMVKRQEASSRRPSRISHQNLPAELSNITQHPWRGCSSALTVTAVNDVTMPAVDKKKVTAVHGGSDECQGELTRLTRAPR